MYTQVFSSGAYIKKNTLTNKIFCTNSHLRVYDFQRNVYAKLKRLHLLGAR